MATPKPYDADIASLILDQIADGKSLRTVCAGEGMPARSTIYLWLSSTPAFADQYARAREDQADSLADEMIEIADGQDAPDNKRVRLDARKWIASKLKAKTYGDKTEHAVSLHATVTLAPLDALL